MEFQIRPIQRFCLFLMFLIIHHVRFHHIHSISFPQNNLPKTTNPVLTTYCDKIQSCLRIIVSLQPNRPTMVDIWVVFTHQNQILTKLQIVFKRISTPTNQKTSPQRENFSLW